jgi:hypothetical protein
MSAKKYFILCLSLFVFTSVSFAQYGKIRSNNIYLSAGSSIDFQDFGPLYSVASVAYERNIYVPRNGVWNARAGVGTVFLLAKELGYHYHADLVYVHGAHFHHIEFCLGISGLYNSRINEFEWWTNNLEQPLPLSIYSGYRFHLPNGRYIFRAGIGWPEQISMSVGTSF